MPVLKNRFITSLAIATLILFSSTISYAAEAGSPEERAEAIRNLIIQLNSTYSTLNRSLKELEEGMGALPDTLINISLRKRDKDLQLLFVDILDNDRPMESHLYLPAENEALNLGGRHQLYNGAVREGTHKFKVIYSWKTDSSVQHKGETVIPISIMLGKTYFIDLSVLKTGDRVELLYSQLDFSSR